MTNPSRASSLATAIDRAEERMALTEVKQETQEDGAIKPTEAPLKVTVIESNVLNPGSSRQLQAAPRSGGGSVVETTVVRDYRNGFKGTFARVVNHFGGRRLFGWFLRGVVAAIENAPEADSAINPGTPTR